jgi:phage gpG-like protein
MAVIVQDNSDAFFGKVAAAAEVGLNRAALYVSQQVQESLNATNGSVVAGTGGDSGRRGRYVPSTPGTAPGTRSGRLRNSITTSKVGPLRRAVGTNVKYARIHELGGVINHPGGTPYIIVGPGRAAFISNKKAAQIEGKGQQVKRTRAHPITMPKRPFLVPGLMRAKASGNLQKVFDAGFKAGFRGGA